MRIYVIKVEGKDLYVNSIQENKDGTGRTYITFTKDKTSCRAYSSAFEAVSIALNLPRIALSNVQDLSFKAYLVDNQPTKNRYPKLTSVKPNNSSKRGGELL